MVMAFAALLDEQALARLNFCSIKGPQQICRPLRRLKARQLPLKPDQLLDAHARIVAAPGFAVLCVNVAEDADDFGDISDQRAQISVQAKEWYARLVRRDSVPLNFFLLRCVPDERIACGRVGEHCCEQLFAGRQRHLVQDMTLRVQRPWP